MQGKLGFCFTCSELILNFAYRYQVISPSKFQIGNIVEAQMSFQVVPVRGGQHMMLVVLRSLALLDSKQTRVSDFNFLILVVTHNLSGSQLG